MSTEPGSSKTKGSSPDHPHKKQKVDDEVKLEVKSTVTIESLPDEMMIEIFGHLTFKERLLAQKVCNRWQNLMRSDVFWRYVKVTNISASLLVEIISLLPTCVLHLECHAEEYTSFLLTLPQLIVKLYEKCPFLKTIILENVNFINNCPLGVLRYKFFQVDPNQPVCPVFDLNEGEYHEEEEIELLDAVLPELQVLSLRSVQCSPLHLYTHLSTTVLPALVVLDLSFSVPSAVIELKDGLFSTLVNLEELYLVGWNTRDYSIEKFLKHARKLRILDLESSTVTKNTILALKQNSKWIEKLYLACIHDLGDIRKTADDEVFFPRLQILCVKHTNVTIPGIEELLAVCPLLEFVNVNYCENIHRSWYRNLPDDIKEKVHLNAIGDFICNHFLKTKYCITEDYF